jgi:hypothetical protein
LIGTAQVGVCHGEIRIEFNGPLKLRNSGSLIAFGEKVQRKTVGLQRLQRRSSRLRQRNVEFLNGTERFAEFSPQVRSNLFEGGQDLGFFSYLRLLSR